MNNFDDHDSELTAFKDMSPNEQAYLRRALKDADSNRKALRELQDADYLHAPASIKEFLMSEDLLGPIAQINNWDDDSIDESGLVSVLETGAGRFVRPR